MRTDTKLFEMLEYLYNHRHRYVNRKEISENTSIDFLQVTPYYKRLSSRIKKIRVEGMIKYKLNKSDVDYIGELIRRSKDEARNGGRNTQRQSHEELTR
jgi:DNA-directed RNA polymerase alpha subunit